MACSDPVPPPLEMERATSLRMLPAGQLRKATLSINRLVSEPNTASAGIGSELNTAGILWRGWEDIVWERGQTRERTPLLRLFQPRLSDFLGEVLLRGTGDVHGS